jgi:pimeloyl-ACP methyl ester carboxylesterase
MRYADAGSVRIAYDDEGPRADDAVVFLGGWCNSGRSFFAPLAERLAARHRVIRLDWRGHGDSGRPAADFGHDELADDAMAVIGATGVRHVVPVTQAHGGWPALRLRRLLGDRVPRIVLLSWMVLDPPPPFMAVFEMLADPGRWRQGLDNLLGGWLAGAPENVAGWTRRETGSYGFDMWSRAARAVTADYGRYGSPLRAATELDQKPDLLHLYSQPRTDGFLAGQQEFSAAHPWFSARRLNGVTHFPALEIPDATTAEIERFLSAAPG